MILVFQTSVSTKREIKSVAPVLNSIVPITRWSFDIGDSDGILRIESLTDISGQIILLLNDKGFDCMELED
jgi:hypothetical protein